jgi:multiple sugar transport system substrate-binding protein
MQVSAYRSAILPLGLLAASAAAALWPAGDTPVTVPAGRQEVVFWHFWGGKDRAVVEDIVARFNASQDRHWVRAIAVSGNNLDLKFFLGVAGGDPPDVLNQDDPVVADWAARRAIVPLDELAPEGEIDALEDGLYPAARELGTYDGRLYALANGLDLRALYYDAEALDELGLPPPQTLADLDAIAEAVVPPWGTATQPQATTGGSATGSPPPTRRHGFLPDPRRLWAWGIVFGGSFYDPATGSVTADSDEIVRALDWMCSYSRRYGADEVAAFRTGDQALAGASFPLLERRYVVVMDGQWRVAEMAAAQEAAAREGRPVPRYGVVPLPPPPFGRARAGWVNGNFFVVPRGAKNPQGAWAFMKFWSGFGGHEDEAARACAAGGWIPVSQAVVDRPEFQDYLRRYPEFGEFVALAASPSQVPVPAVPGAAYFNAEVIRAAEDAMYRGVPPRQALEEATRRIQTRIDVLRESGGNQAGERPEASANNIERSCRSLASMIGSSRASPRERKRLLTEAFVSHSRTFLPHPPGEATGRFRCK